ncbi:MAG: spore cortex biosynthesis protein YabQ [Clostridia bacterium]|nr:spore cortex biosynthesis protein YabQ [Clostridia bacterium]
MEYIQGLADQTEIFLYALGFGFLLGIIYGVFRALRLIISNSGGFVFFMDFLYFAVCTFLIFCFIMVTDNGRIRLYVAFGIILGWTVCYFSFGAITVRVFNAIIKGLKRVFCFLFKPFRRFGKEIYGKMRKNAVFRKKNIRNSDKKVKFNLQKYKGMVYNLIGCTEKRNISKKEND